MRRLRRAGRHEADFTWRLRVTLAPQTSLVDRLHRSSHSDNNGPVSSARGDRAALDPQGYLGTLPFSMLPGIHPDALLGLMRGRRSVRSFSERSVPKETLEKVLEAARWAPSAGNRQAFRLYVVMSPAKLAEMADAVEDVAAKMESEARADLKESLSRYIRNFVHFKNAPVVIAPIFRPGVDLLPPGDTATGTCLPDRRLIDALSSVSAAIMNLTLAAHSLSLGTCWMTGPLIAATKLRDIVDVPSGWELAALVALGHPAEIPEPPKRRALEALVRYIE